MSSFLDMITGKKQSSANAAKERLQFVLIHDRADISPGEMEKLKNEILEVISRYVNIDPKSVKIDMAHEGREQRLIADIPILSSSKK